MASLGLVRRLPPPMRRLVITTANRMRGVLEEKATDDAADLASLSLAARLPKTDGNRRYVGTRVVVGGLFGVRCGLQRGADLMVRDLQQRRVDVLPFDFTKALDFTPNIDTSATSDPAELAAWQPTDFVVHMNPPLFARALAAFTGVSRLGTTIIACWVWELPVLPPNWRIFAELADEIWTPSPFVAEAAKQGLPDYPGPIRIVPYAVDSDPMQPLPPNERASLRPSFGIARDDFVVGTSFSFDSNYARKNPGAAIEAFRLAFRADEPVCLVVRCNDTGRFQRLFEHLVSFAGDDPRIKIWDMAVAPCPIRRFYGLLDLYISLHRSEGYGLNLVEAAQAGVDVLATGWGLAPDIAARARIRTVASRLVVPLDTQRVYERYPDALWAEPDLHDAISGLQAAYASWSVARAKPA